MTLPVSRNARFGLTARLRTRAAARETVALLEDLGFDSLWAGDHVVYTSPIHDPIVQLAYAAAHTERLILGTCVYLLPLRPAAAVAKQVATLDHLCEGRVIFGVGVGGEFPEEFDACGVDVRERGARLSEGIDVVKKLWTGEPVTHAGRFLSFESVHMQPPPFQSGGPPIWGGARAEPALKRLGRMADGWISYVVTPERYAEGLVTIEGAAEAAGRQLRTFGTAHLLFVRIDDRYDQALQDASAILSKRYAMDFSNPAKRYCALGPPERVAGDVVAFHRAGVRHFVLDMLGTPEESHAQLRRFAHEVRPLLDLDE